MIVQQIHSQFREANMANLNINGILKSTGGGGSYLDVDLVSEIGENYIRYNNGVQICFDTVQMNGTRSFPKQFSQTPCMACVGQPSSSTTVAWNLNIYSLNTSNFNIRYGGTSSSDTGGNASYIAIGKWK